MNYETVKAFSALFGLLLFMGVFIAVVIYTFRPGSKKIHDEHAQIPLNEDK